MTDRSASDVASIQARLDELSWYHAIDVLGATTPGWFDLRHALDLIPIPDVRGKRCLDVGTWDGFYAFELERRGAAEVVALDLPDLTELDYPPEVRADPDFDPTRAEEQPRQAGFNLLHELLDSKVQFRPGNIYDLDPDEVGTFDFVVVGSLLVHLRDPIRALDAVRKVTSGSFLSVDYVHPPLNVLSPRRPIFELRAQSHDFQWWLASDAGYRHLLEVSGFEVDEASKFFLLRPGAMQKNRRTFGNVTKQVLNGVVARDARLGGHLHRAYLTHPRF